MDVKISSSPVRLTVFLSGELDHHSAASMRAQTDKAIIESTARLIRLDFGQITFMDSSGIGFVMGRYRLAHGKGAQVEVTNLTKKYLQIMKLAGLEKLVSLKSEQEVNK
ncbi:MAG: anti-sigma factor antagonist [Clostridia bacterium]|nr:anti-sigma factor antagonist [Clostridia bacterium]